MGTKLKAIPMKNHICTLALIFLTTLVCAQEGFKIGAHGGIPLGDFNDKIGLVIGADVGYMWGPEQSIRLGDQSRDRSWFW